MRNFVGEGQLDLSHLSAFRASNVQKHQQVLFAYAYYAASSREALHRFSLHVWRDSLLTGLPLQEVFLPDRLPFDSGRKKDS